MNINSTEKWTAFVEKLIRLTRNGQLQWHAVEPGTRRKSSEGPVYIAKVLKDKHVGIYRYTYKSSYDGLTFHEMEDVHIELVDDEGNYLWRVPAVENRVQLMDVVEFEFAGGGALLEEFLGVD